MSVGNYLVYPTGTGNIIPWLGDLNWVRAEKSSLAPGMRTFTLSLLLIWLVSLHPCLGFPTVMNYNCNPSVSWSLSGCFNHGTDMKSGQEWTHTLILGFVFLSSVYSFFFLFWNVSHRMWLGSWRYSVSGGAYCYLYFCLVVLLIDGGKKTPPSQSNLPEFWGAVGVRLNGELPAGWTPMMVCYII